MTGIRICFFISNLGGGGAEMHMLRLVNALNKKQFEVHVILARGGGSYLEKLDSEVHLHVLNNKATSSSMALLTSVPRPKNYFQNYHPTLP